MFCGPPSLVFKSQSSLRAGGPSITISQPTKSAVQVGSSVVLTTAATAQLQGTAAGGNGIVSVLWVDNLGTRGKADIQTTPGTPGASVNWTATVPLRAGGNQITVIAVDRNNKSATAQILVHNTGIAPAAPAAPVVRSAVWRGKSVTYEVIDGIAVAEGDMILGTAADLENTQGVHAASSKGNIQRAGFAVDYTALLWPNVGGVVKVPYIITTGPAAAPAITAFNASLAGYVQYVPRNGEPNYVNFNLTTPNGGSCVSSVGMVGGAQTITGDPNCNVPVLIHEMGHSIGLYHEHQRPDYATYIALNLANVDKPIIQGNFDQATSNDQAIGFYNYASVMHYGAFTFTKNGLPIIESIPAGIPLSNNVGFSIGDIDAIRRLYGFVPAVITITTNPPGLQVTVDGSTVTAPQTFSWPLNSMHTLNVPADPQFTTPNDGSTYQYGRWNDNVARSHTVTVSPGSGFPTSPATQPAVTVYEANFIRLQPFASSVFPAASGTVSPTPAPQSIFGGFFYVDRQQVALSAIPTGGFNFAGWFSIPQFSQSDNPKTLLIQSPVTGAQAYFVNAPVTIIGATSPQVVPLAPPFNGAIDGNFTYLPQGFANDLNFGGLAWAPATLHQISVSSPESPITTNIRYNFNSWNDGGAISHQISASSSGLKALTATFIPAYRTFALFNPSCGGTVNFSPVSPTNDGYYNDGTMLTSTAVPNAGILFAGWTGDLAGLANPQTVTLHDEFIPTANFNTVAAPITVTGFSPVNAPATASAMDITINGTGFTNTTQTFWNLSFRNSTFVSSTQLTMHLNAGDLSAPGGQRVSVQNVAGGCNLFFEGTFDVKLGNTPPTADSVTGIAPGSLTQTATFKYSSANGFAYITDAHALFNSAITPTGGCWIDYNKGANALYLLSDGVTAAQSLTVGTNGSIGNAQCTLNGASAGSTVSGAGNTLTVVLNVVFTSQFGASHSIYMFAGDAGNMTSGWQTKGTTAGMPNAPPTADSVTGINVGSLNQPALVLKYSSVNGAGYLMDTYALFNSALSAANGCMVLYDKTVNGFYLINDAGNAVLGPLAQNAASTIANSQCTLNGTGSSVSLSGNTLTMNLNLTFTAAFGTAHTVFMYAADAGGLNSGWQQKGTTGSATAPTADSAATSAAGNLAQTLTLKYSSVNGFGYLSNAHALFNSSLSGTGACWVFYNRPVNGFYLINDAGTSFLGPLTVGSAGTLTNSQCTLNGTGSSVSGTGNTLTVILSVTFTASFGAGQNIFIYAGDQAGNNSGWQAKGTTAQSAPPTADTVTGMANGSAAQSLTLKYSSVNGYPYLSGLQALVNGALNGTGACWVFYSKPADSFYLVNDAGTAFLGPLARGTGGTLVNTQCTLNGTGSTVTGSANTLTMTLNLSIAGLHGAESIFMYASDAGAMNSGWQNRGTVTLP